MIVIFSAKTNCDKAPRSLKSGVAKWTSKFRERWAEQCLWVPVHGFFCSYKADVDVDLPSTQTSRSRGLSCTSFSLTAENDPSQKFVTEVEVYLPTQKPMSKSRHPSSPSPSIVVTQDIFAALAGLIPVSWLSDLEFGWVPTFWGVSWSLLCRLDDARRGDSPSSPSPFSRDLLGHRRARCASVYLPDAGRAPLYQHRAQTR